jgi:hypothetical protein
MPHLPEDLQNHCKRWTVGALNAEALVLLTVATGVGTECLTDKTC